MNVLDLFSGIGGFALGLESVGMRTVAFCEREPYAAAVLRKHWPDTPIYPDVRHLDAATLRGDGIGPIDLICGGFPCQPFSVAGERRGTADERHLWPEFARIVGECRPAWVVAENVPGIRSIAADGVCADLEALGYAVWPVVVGAGHAGAPHRRQRVWFVARDANDDWQPNGAIDDEAPVVPRLGGCDLAHSERCRQPATRHDGFNSQALGAGEADWLGSGGQVLANADSAGLAQRQGERGNARAELAASLRNGWWLAQSGLGRMVDGLPDWAHEPAEVPRVAKNGRQRRDRLRCLGNAAVPAVVAMIGAWIMQQRRAR